MDNREALYQERLAVYRRYREYGWSPAGAFWHAVNGGGLDHSGEGATRAEVYPPWFLARLLKEDVA